MMADRAERRRDDKMIAKSEQYLNSGFRGPVHEAEPLPSRSRYMPHVGAKQRAKGKAKIDAALVASMGMKERVS